MTDTQRNFIILALIVIVVMTFGTAQLAAGLLFQVLNIVFTVLIGLAMLQWYRRNQSKIDSIKPGPRTVLQLSMIGGFAAFFTGTVFPGWGMHGTGAAAMFAIMILCGFGVYWAWQQRSQLW